MTFSLTDFIRAQTIVQATEFVPEIKLHLATEITSLWHMTEKEFGETNPGSGSGAGLPPPFWAFAWPGGQGLARYILDHPEIAHGRRVLDFASGCGIASIAAHKAGAARVLASDIDMLAVAALQMNAELNGVKIEDAGALNLDKPYKGADLILAGDVCYQQTMSATVTHWLRLNVEAGVRVLLADPGRAWVPEEGLTEAARYRIPTLLELEDRETRDVTVWEMAIVR